MLKAAEVKVGGAYGANVVVDDDGLGVEHAVVVEVYLDNGIQTLRYI